MSAFTSLRSRGWEPGLTVGLLVAGIVVVVAAATRTATHRAGATLAERQLRRLPALAVLADKARATEAAFGDSAARELAAAAGLDLVLLDTTTGTDPRILASSLRRDAALGELLREWTTAGGAAATTPVRVRFGGRSYYAASQVLPAVDGRPARRLIAMAPTDIESFSGMLIIATTTVAGVLALLVVVLLESRLNQPTESTAEVAAAARDAALVDRVGHAPALSDDDLARVATTPRSDPRPADPTVVDDWRLLPGHLFADRYEIIEMLGRSDVRTAYKVRDRELSQLVVLKTLHAGAFGGDATGVAQFKADLRVVRRLAHRNILRTYDFGEASVYYVTMELVDATPLHELLLQQERLSVHTTISIAMQASRALSVAHRERVLHRDIRPQSLLLDSSGVLKVADFGLATTAQRTRALARTSASADVIAYVPPEVLQAQPVDARSDLYSLAVVLYQCLAGRLPTLIDPANRGEQDEAIEPLSSIDPAVPQGFSDLISQTLSSHPAMRPATVDTFRHRLSLVSAAVQ